MNSKTDYRIYAKELRKNLNMPVISKQLADEIRNNTKYKSAKNVMLFYPTKYEVDLKDLLKDNKKFYLPKVATDTLWVCPYKEPLIKSSLNIMEPNTKPVNPDILDLIIVPALMADKKGYRLGYGKGFYDRFLRQYPNAYTITAIPKALCINNLPHDEFDIKINCIIKEP